MTNLPAQRKVPISYEAFAETMTRMGNFVLDLGNRIEKFTPQVIAIDGFDNFKSETEEEDVKIILGLWTILMPTCVGIVTAISGKSERNADTADAIKFIKQMISNFEVED